MKKPKMRLTVGLLMILVAIAALMVHVFENSRRTQVIFDNRSWMQIHQVTVSYGGQIRRLGPIEPRKHLAFRIPVPPGEPVRLAFEVKGNSGAADRTIRVPAITTSGTGSVIQMGWDGP